MFVLERFSENNAAQVLSWRNSERVRSNMINNEVIPTYQHSKFLNALNSDSSRSYFVVNYNGKAVGCIYFLENSHQEVLWGAYTSSENILPGLFPALLYIAIHFSFKVLGAQMLNSEVALRNEAPRKMNKFFGIKEVGSVKYDRSSGEKSEFIQYSLTRGEADNVQSKILLVIPRRIREDLKNNAISII